MTKYSGKTASFHHAGEHQNKPEIRRPERIAKRMARSGLCSRRQAEAYIFDGRVKVNGQTLDRPGVEVTNQDVIEVDGVPLKPIEPTRLWRYHKPKGLIVSNQDELGRETIFNHLPTTMPRVISVGRLDLNSEGLLLLTNDGDLARHLELPATGWMRKYRVRVHGRVDQAKLDDLAEGVSVDGVHYGPILARLDRQMPSNAWLSVALREGKNREIRHIMNELGYSVTRLLRLSYGPFALGSLKIGDLEEIKPSHLAQQLGLADDKNVDEPEPQQRLKFRPKQRAKRMTGPGSGQRSEQRSGQRSEHGSGQRSGQGAEQRSGQRSGQGSGQRSGQGSGQRSGQGAEQRSGQRSGQGSGQRSGQGSGQRSGQGSGQRSGQGSGQRSGQGSGQGQRYKGR